MAMIRKTSKTYYFSVEGETEQWYLYWLKDLIDASQEATHKVNIDSKIEKDPLRRMKSLTITSRTEIFHLSDYESNDESHVRSFKKTMDNMKAAMTTGKQVYYRFGYSNFSFDLWIVLHKTDCNGPLSHRSKYLTKINQAYHEKFESMDDYKQEKNFKRCLGKLTIDDVRMAIARAEDIMKRNEENGYILEKYKGFTYYKENPSLMVWQAVKEILIDCDLLREG